MATYEPTARRIYDEPTATATDKIIATAWSIIAFVLSGLIVTGAVVVRALEWGVLGWFAGALCGFAFVGSIEIWAWPVALVAAVGSLVLSAVSLLGSALRSWSR